MNVSTGLFKGQPRLTGTPKGVRERRYLRSFEWRWLTWTGREPDENLTHRSCYSTDDLTSPSLREMMARTSSLSQQSPCALLSCTTPSNTGAAVRCVFPPCAGGNDGRCSGAVPGLPPVNYVITCSRIQSRKRSCDWKWRLWAACHETKGFPFIFGRIHSALTGPAVFEQAPPHNVR